MLVNKTLIASRYMVQLWKFKGQTILLTFHLQSSFSYGTKVLLGQW